MQYKNESDNNGFLTYTKKKVPNNLDFSNYFKNQKNGKTKESNVHDFIKRKNKFYIQDFFDEKKAENFLVSKKEALMEIKLYDEISGDRDSCQDDTINIKKSKNDINDNITEEKTNNKSNKSNNQTLNENINKSPNTKKSRKSMEKKKMTDSPDSKKKRKISKIKVGQTTEIKNEKNNTNNSADNSKNSNDDLNNSNYIYKFIIDNANDSDDKLYKKLKKEIKKTETKKKRLSINDNISRMHNNIINNNITSTPKAKNQNLLNPFYFSQKAKNLMVNEKIELSAINNSSVFQENNNNSTNNNEKTLCTSNKGENAKKNISITQNVVNNNNTSNKDISNKESLMHILSDLE